MASLRSLAIKFRRPFVPYWDWDLDEYIDKPSFPDVNMFLTVILELAHAISRGKLPSSCSILPGVNVREYLQVVFFETDKYEDEWCNECSLAEYFNDKTRGLLASEYLSTPLFGISDYNELSKIENAIDLVKRKLLKPCICEIFVIGGEYCNSAVNYHKKIKRELSWRKKDSLKDPADDFEPFTDDHSIYADDGVNAFDPEYQNLVVESIRQIDELSMGNALH